MKQDTSLIATNQCAGLAAKGLVYQRHAWAAFRAATDPQSRQEAQHAAIDAGDMAICLRYSYHGAVRSDKTNPKSTVGLAAIDLSERCVKQMQHQACRAYAAIGQSPPAVFTGAEIRLIAEAAETGKMPQWRTV